MYNSNSLDTICGALSYAMGIDAPKQAAEKNADLAAFVDAAFGGEKADRIVMYNPDAIAQWIYEKYADYTKSMDRWADVKIPLRSVMPSVTPVCFGTMYTGAQPEVHGIQKYEKPVIKIDTIFDALLRAGKRVAVVTYGKCSISRIFLEREMDYYHYEEGPLEQVSAKALELILRDEHDFIVIYHGNYDSVMHKNGPESARSLAELRANCSFYSTLCFAIEEHWKHHNTLVGFAMDHGCHEIDGNCGSHGLDMEEDLNIVHTYKAFSKNKKKESLDIREDIL